MFGFAGAAGEGVAKDEFDLRVDTAQLRLGEALQLRPHGGIETEQERLLVGHRRRSTRASETQAEGGLPYAHRGDEAGNEPLKRAVGQLRRHAGVGGDDDPMDTDDEKRKQTAEGPAEIRERGERALP